MQGTKPVHFVPYLYATICTQNFLNHKKTTLYQEKLFETKFHDY